MRGIETRPCDIDERDATTGQWVYQATVYVDGPDEADEPFDTCMEAALRKWLADDDITSGMWAIFDCTSDLSIIINLDEGTTHA